MDTPIDAMRRQALERSVPFTFRAAQDGEGDGDGLTLEGYAAVWDQPTEIDSWEGEFTEQIRKGAFKKTLREQTPVLQFDHGYHRLIGSIPIGAFEELSEDDQGLYVRARLSDNWLIEPVRDAIRDRAIKGMSFRFNVIRDEWRDKDNKVLSPVEVSQLLWKPGDRGPLQRTLIEVRCSELGPVVFPAYTGTSVSVRDRQIAQALIHDEDLSREILRSLATNSPPPRELAALQLSPREAARAVLFYSTPTPAGPRSRAVTADGVVEGSAAAADIEQAIAALRNRTSDTPPDQGHLSATEPRQRAGLSPVPGAPLTEEHPPSTTDAPLATEHPSAPNPFATRLRSQISEVTGLMDARLAEIEKDKS